MDSAPIVIVIVMGVSGSGKSTVGRLLAQTLGWPFADGDDFHSPANVARMRSGRPLADADREPWLAAIAAWAREHTGGAVIACSALRRSYRDVLRGGAAQARFALLSADPAALATRLVHRPAHFMPPGLLASQLSTLEPLEPDEIGITVSTAGTPAQIVAAIRAGLDLVLPGDGQRGP